MEQRSWYRVSLRLAARFLSIVGFLFVLVTVTPIDSWWTRKLAGQSYSPTGDVMIVLGGFGLPDGRMGWDTYLRTRYAAKIYHEGGFKQVVVAGGPGYDTKVPVSVAMGEFLKCQGVPAESLLLETASRSTRENALYSKPLLDGLPGRKVLLTGDYHMFRARRVFAKTGVQVASLPIPEVQSRSGSWRGRSLAFFDLSEETCKIVYYWLRGWI